MTWSNMPFEQLMPLMWNGTLETLYMTHGGYKIIPEGGTERRFRLRFRFIRIMIEHEKEETQ